MIEVSLRRRKHGWRASVASVRFGRFAVVHDGSETEALRQCVAFYRDNRAEHRRQAKWAAEEHDKMIRGIMTEEGCDYATAVYLFEEEGT